MQWSKRHKRKSATSGDNRQRRYMTLGTLFLCLLFLVSSIMTSFAWYDFTQTKTNVFRGAVEKADVVLSKYEKDANGVIQADPVSAVMNAQFQLYRIETDGSETLILGGPWYTDIKGQIIFDGRDSKHQKLEPGKYVFVETKPSFGYTYDKDENGNDITRYVFEVTQADILGGKAVNVTAYNRRDRGTLAVKKTVMGNAPEGDEFTYTVTFSDGGTYSYRIDGGEKISIASGGTFTLKHGQTAVFEDIPIGVQYRVVETAHPDYIISSNGHQGNISEAGSVAAFVNTYVTEPPNKDEKVKLTVTKQLAGEYPNADKDKEFTFTLIVDGKELTFTLKPGESKDFEVNEGSQYEVIEDNYFTDEYIQSIINGFGTVGKEDIEVVVTNTFVGEPVVDIEGEKKWVLGSNSDVTLPEYITIQLKNGDTVVAEKVVMSDANGDWKYIFTAPKYDADGKVIQYTIEELPVSGFIPTYNGYHITNTYVEPITADPPVVTKVVEGENAPETKFAFVMKGLDGAPMPEGAVGDTMTIQINGSGEAEFGSIRFTMPGVYTYNIYETNGGEAGWTYDSAKYTIVFTVTEADGKLTVSQQTIERDGEAVDKVQFTNSYTEPPATTVIVQGQKTWEHGDNPIANQPESIVVYVYADGNLVVQRQVGEQDNWSYSFELPRFAEDGHEIIYTIDEADVPNYEKSIDGYNILNTYTGVADDTVRPSEPGGTTDTGDYVSFVPWLVLLLTSGTMLIIILCLRKKKRRSTKDR